MEKYKLTQQDKEKYNAIKKFALSKIDKRKFVSDRELTIKFMIEIVYNLIQTNTPTTDVNLHFGEKQHENFGNDRQNQCTSKETITEKKTKIHTGK